MPNAPRVEPFAIRDCALIAVATGSRAETLKDLRDNLLDCPAACLYYHFWGGLLHTRLEEREYNNDFAAWAWHALHDRVLGERLAMIDPTSFGSLEDLRRELIEVIEQRLDEHDYLLWATRAQQFQVVQSRTVVFVTDRRPHQPPPRRFVLGQPLAGAGQKRGAGRVAVQLGEASRTAHDPACDELAPRERRAHALKRGPGLEFPGAREEQRELVGAEALLRWNCPAIGAIGPDEFIPIAENSGLILSIGEWVLRQVAAQQRAWIDAGLKVVTVAVNLSMRDLHDPSVPLLIKELLLHRQMPPSALTIACSCPPRFWPAPPLRSPPTCWRGSAPTSRTRRRI